MASTEHHLDTRLSALADGWPATLGAQFSEYRRALKSGTGPSIAIWGGSCDGPYWIELPEWVARDESVATPGGLQRLIRDMVWGQVCLFYAVRIEDDIFDGQLSRTSLALAPTLLMNESLRVFSSHFDMRSAFWEFYGKAIDSTLEGILGASELQRDPMAPAELLLQTYARVDSIFSIGSAGVCEKLGTGSIVPALCLFVGEIGKVAQVIDDFEDLDEDLADGRFNYVAKVLLDKSGSSMRDPGLLTKNLNTETQGAAMKDISARLHACLDVAGRAAGALELPAALDLIESYRGTIRQLSFTWVDSCRGIFGPR